MPHRAQLSHQGPGQVPDPTGPLTCLLLISDGKDEMLDGGLCHTLAGFVALPLLKVEGYGLENTSGKCIPSCLTGTEGSMEQTEPQ